MNKLYQLTNQEKQKMKEYNPNTVFVVASAKKSVAAKKEWFILTTRSIKAGPFSTEDVANSHLDKFPGAVVKPSTAIGIGMLTSFANQKKGKGNMNNVKRKFLTDM